MKAHANPSRTSTASRPAPKQTTDANGCPAWHEGFLRLLPDILRHARKSLRGLTPQAREEAIDEVLALALVGYARLAELDKLDLAYATPLAGYAVAQYRSGRRVGVRANACDVLSEYAQQRKRITVERLDRFDRRSGSWKEVVVEDRRFTAADVAATRIDFGAWLKSLTKRNRRLAEKLATGESTSTVARLFGISGGRVSQLRRELCDAWRLFQGEPSTA
jgi:hypothetical protein